MVALFWCLVSAAAVGYGTWAAGAIVVPVVALLAGWLAPVGARPGFTVPFGAALGWAVLLLRAARAPGFGPLMTRLEGLLPLSPGALAGVTLALGLVLGLGGALIGIGLRRPVPPGPAA